MKGSDFKAGCDAIADITGGAAGAGWAALGEIIAAPPAATVAERLKLLEDLPQIDAAEEAATLAPMAETGESVLSLLRVFGKGATANAVEKALDWAWRHRAAELDALKAACAERLASAPPPKAAPALDPTLIAAFAGRLKEALGSEGFNAIYQELSADKTLKTAGIKEVARALTGRAGRGKKDSLDRIWGMHADILDGKKRIAASGGRSAA